EVSASVKVVCNATIEMARIDILGCTETKTCCNATGRALPTPRDPTQICSEMREFVLGKKRELLQQKKLDSSQDLESSKGQSFTAKTIHITVRTCIFYTRDKQCWTNTNIRLEATTGKDRALQ